MAKRFATLLEKIAIKEQLDKHITVSPDGKSCIYKDGMIDQSIADIVGGGIQSNHVAKVRAELFPKLRRKHNPNRRKATPDRELRAKFNELVSMLDTQLGLGKHAGGLYIEDGETDDTE